MKLKNTALTGGDGLAHSKISPDELTEIRRHVISGDWTAINNRVCTLNDLGLRHNGGGLVWLRSGVSVHDADSDAGFSGAERASFEYHAPLCTNITLKYNENLQVVQAQHIDNYCHNIIFSSPAYSEFTHRKDGKPLSTFAVQIDPIERKKAVNNWHIYRNPKQSDKYVMLHADHHAGLIGEHERRCWQRESIGYLAGVVRDNAEFGRLMVRFGFVQVRTRKITGKLESFWLYRSTRKELSGITPLCTEKTAPNKVLLVTVQVSDKPQKGFKRVAVDGKWLFVYDDHIRFLTKKRVRVDGRQVTGYTAKGVHLEVSE
ncbi:TPA: hypothetical protein KNG84_003445 [Serratia fonticola]|nr:hypothetical protein [Serratia fonticola]HBE9091377.1 hypothetical protein [Serratia fonticola]